MDDKQLAKGGLPACEGQVPCLYIALEAELLALDLLQRGDKVAACEEELLHATGAFAYEQTVVQVYQVILIDNESVVLDVAELNVLACLPPCAACVPALVLLLTGMANNQCAVAEEECAALCHTEVFQCAALVPCQIKAVNVTLGELVDKGLFGLCHKDLAVLHGIVGHLVGAAGLALCLVHCLGNAEQLGARRNLGNAGVAHRALGAVGSVYQGHRVGVADTAHLQLKAGPCTGTELAEVASTVDLCIQLAICTGYSRHRGYQNNVIHAEYCNVVNGQLCSWCAGCVYLGSGLCLDGA